MAACSKLNCHSEAVAKGLCGRHYRRSRDGRYIEYRRSSSPGEGLGWLKLHQEHTDSECLIWPFGCSDAGIGYVVFEDRKQTAHRVMCVLSKGPPPTANHIACHTAASCKQGCVNPNHLIWGTRGSQARGRKHRKGKTGPKLTLATAEYIRNSDKSGRELASELGVTVFTISKIRCRVTYK